ncbi:MAG: aldose epimerase family protein [Oscillospiraceae bacterium]
MKLETRPFGQTQAGETVTAWTLRWENGMALTLLDYGATVQSLYVPRRCGAPVDVVLGYDTVEEYEKNDGYLGATVGRVANRIGKGQFTLGGKTYQLALNDGENHLHGGVRGFDKYVWQVRAEDDSLVCTRLSPDGEEGYPGNLQLEVRFTLTDSALTVAYTAQTDRDTIVSLTNHSYFNLASGGDVLEHTMQVNANRFLQTDAGCLPTGKVLSVAGTAFDFREPRRIGCGIAQGDANFSAGGYDHNFVLAGCEAAVLCCEETGIRMRVETDLPGVQVYTANSLTPRAGKRGSTMGQRGAVCLETQLFPDALAHYGFPSPVLHAGETLHTATSFTFETF